jgi:arsenate reductase (thioredoxin)
MKVYNVLFVCTGNSARSILAEAILNDEGQGQFRAFSAGSHPKGEVHPEALSLLREFGYATHDLRSKSWDEFIGEGAPALDFVFTVCSNASAETCPVYPGQPLTANWAIDDPAAASVDAQKEAFWQAYCALQRRIELFLTLPIESIDELNLKSRLRSIPAGAGIDQHAA